MLLTFDEFSTKNIKNVTLRAQLIVEQKQVLMDKLGMARNLLNSICSIADSVGDVRAVPSTCPKIDEDLHSCILPRVPRSWLWDYCAM